MKTENKNKLELGLIQEIFLIRIDKCPNKALCIRHRIKIAALREGREGQEQGKKACKCKVLLHSNVINALFSLHFLRFLLATANWSPAGQEQEYGPDFNLAGVQ